MKDNKLENSHDILREIEFIFAQEKNYSCQCISVHDLILYVKNQKKKHNNLILNYQHQIEQNLTLIGISILNTNFNYETKQLIITYKTALGERKTCIVTKENKEIIIEDNTYYNQYILDLSRKEINRLYMQYLLHERYSRNKQYYFKPINSNFNITLDYTTVKISIPYVFSLESTIDQKKDKKCSLSHKCIAKSANIYEDLTGYEDELLQSLYINIKDCPFWSQDDLYEIRSNKLKKDEKEKIRKRTLF